jgi:hypothetical protein
VEVKEQEHMPVGGEWVKRPKGAKGCEIWRPLEGLGYVRVDKSFGLAEDCSKLVQLAGLVQI